MMFNFKTAILTAGAITFLLFVSVTSWDAGTMNGAKIAYDCYTNAAAVDVCQSRLEDIIWPRGK